MKLNEGKIQLFEKKKEEEKLDDAIPQREPEVNRPRVGGFSYPTNVVNPPRMTPQTIRESEVYKNLARKQGHIRRMMYG